MGRRRRASVWLLVVVRRRKREVPCLRGTMPLALGWMTARLVGVGAGMDGATRR